MPLPPDVRTTLGGGGFLGGGDFGAPGVIEALSGLISGPITSPCVVVVVVTSKGSTKTNESRSSSALGVDSLSIPLATGETSVESEKE